MAMKSYRVLREHEGDKPYKEGDLRKADHMDVKHLVDLGVLKVLGDAPKPRAQKTKQSAPLKNKMQSGTANKDGNSPAAN